MPEDPLAAFDAATAAAGRPPKRDDALAAFDQVVPHAKSSGGAMDYALAVGRGAMSLVPFFDPEATSPAALAQGAASAAGAAARIVTDTPGGGKLPDIPENANAFATVARTIKGLMDGSAEGRTKATRLAALFVPMFGKPISDLLGPTQAYNSGRGPTHEENVAAVEGGATLAVAAVAPKIIKRINARTETVLRARGVTPEAAQAPVADVSPTTPTEPVVEPKINAGMRRNFVNTIWNLIEKRGPDYEIEVPKNVRAAVKSGEIGSQADLAAFLDREHGAVAEPVVSRPPAPRAPETGPPEEAVQSTTSADSGLVDDAGGETSPAAENPSAAPAAGAEPPPLPPAVKAAAFDPTPEPPALPEPGSPDFNSALRTRFTGERGVRRDEGNHIAAHFRKTMTPQELEALSLMRDEKGNPGHLQAMLDGSHKALAGEDADPSRIEALRPVIELAQNPTPAMRAADATFDAYATKTLAEGRERGILESSLTPEEYVPHLLQPTEPRNVDVNAGRLRMGSISRRTPFANRRSYPTILEAVANGVEPRTLNAAVAISVYADKHGTAMATKILTDTLKESDLGKFTVRDSAPEGWSEVGANTRTFKNEVPYHDRSGEESNLAVAHQGFYAPKEIAEALKPITDPNYMQEVRGFQGGAMYQAYLKSVELGLSVFHMRALNLTGLNNAGIGGLVKSYGADLSSPGFIDAERMFIQHGGTTPIEGKTLEAYRALEPTSIPTRVDAIRNLPVFRQLDQAAAATSKLTFDIMQRKLKVTDFAIKDAKWIAQNPDASPQQLATARRALAREVNGAYGGLNWEALGLRKTEHAIMRAIMLAPDWTFSNVETAGQAFRSGPGGKAARWFWARSAVNGLALTAAASLFFAGQLSPNPTQVYLGKDSHGKDVMQNMFFAGAPSDLVNLAVNVSDFGVVQGVAHTIANKLGPFARAAEHLVSNRDFLGNEIVPKGSGLIAGTVRGGASVAGDVLPTPFSMLNIAQMLTDPKNDYSPKEYITTLATGARPRHVSPKGPEPPRNSTWDIIKGAPVHKGQRRR